MATSDGILLVGHGTVTDLADIPAFLTRIRRGRPPDEDLVREVTRRYELVGGSPFLKLSRAQGDALSAAMGLPVYLGMNMWEPWIEDALGAAQADGVARLCIAPLAPFSTHVYRQAVEDAAARRRERGEAVPALCCVEPWGSRPALVEAHVAAVRGYLRGRSPADTELVLSAHSLPRVAIKRGDPYQRQFEAMARAVFERLDWAGVVAYQSQGMGGGEWLGPTVDETLEAASARGRSAVVWAPAGFLTDHVETLFDLDVEAADRARQLGLELVRVPALNQAPGLVSALAEAAREALVATGAP